MIGQIYQYVCHNWFQLAIDLGFGINVVVAGAKVMGWSKLADECQKVENAIAAMVQAALTRGGSNVKVQEPVIRGSVDASGNGPSANNATEPNAH